MTERQAHVGQETTTQQEVVTGLIAAPGLPTEVAHELARRLPVVMQSRHPDVRWTFVVRSDPVAGSPSADVDLVRLARERQLAEGWRFAICLTDLPVRVRRRPVTAFASKALDVGVVSVPAFGPVDLTERVQQAVLYVMDELGSGDVANQARQAPRGLRSRLSRRRQLYSALGRPDAAEQDSVRFITAPSVGNVRLLLGMVRANRPWRLIIGLSRVLVAATGTAALGLVSPPMWWIGDVMSWPRLLTIGLTAAVLICVTLIVGHGLWERPQTPVARERVMLVNLTTAITVAIGVLTLLAALLVVTTLCANAVLLEPVLRNQLGHPPTPGDYFAIAWLVSAMAIIGGALGSALETDVTVREAAYGYRPAEGAGGSEHGSDGVRR